MTSLSEILESRGYVHQYSAGSLTEITDGPKRTLYLGIDPTADSLHAGNLQNVLVLRHFVEAGHKAYVLVGGGTGMIGDPSGKSAERNLLDEKTVQQNTDALITQVSNVVGGGFEVVNNNEWLAKLNLLSFLRDIGKHFSVNDMLRKDSVRSRVEEEGQTISYTEFSYQILQAYDFSHLHREKKMDLQIGASDQWGNIVAGIELVRKKTGDTVYGLTAPLLVDAKTGRKFGKSEGSAVWLDPKKTSPFQFYQFWFNAGDDEVEGFLKRMTFISLVDIAEIMEAHRKTPSARSAQRRLAKEVTALVHGEEAASRVEHISNAVFGISELSTLASDERELLKKEMLTFEAAVGEPLDDVLVRTGLASSKREARQFLGDGAITINGGRVTDTTRNIMHEDFQNADLALLKRGKQHVCVLVERK